MDYHTSLLNLVRRICQKNVHQDGFPSADDCVNSCIAGMSLRYFVQMKICQALYECILFFSSHRTHMQDLKDMTNDNHYENYRCEKLAAMTVGSPTNQPSSK